MVEGRPRDCGLELHRPDGHTQADVVDLTEELRGDTDRATQRIGQAVRRAGPRPESPEDANWEPLRSVAGRWNLLDGEFAEVVAQIQRLVPRRAPQLPDEFGIGADTTAKIPIVAGEDLKRIKPETALAKLTGASPCSRRSARTAETSTPTAADTCGLNAAIAGPRS